MQTNRYLFLFQFQPQSYAVVRHVQNFLLAIAVSLPGSAQMSPESHIDTIGEIVRIDRYQDATGYYVFYPADRTTDPMKLVLFAHGYGALNPMIFGKWIEHLVRQNYCVVYPRYQLSLFQPSPQEFVPNTVTALHDFIRYDCDDLPVDTSEMFMVGHSYGGVIIAHLAARYADYGLPDPRATFVCEPGTGPFSGGVLQTYEEIDPDILLVVMVGMEDATVGQELGLRIFNEAAKTPRRWLIKQFADRNGDEQIGASHYEPYALDARFDNGISNFTSNKALRVSAFDQVDVHGYWRIFDQMVAHSEKELTDDAFIGSIGDLGTWSDGTPVRKLEISSPGGH